MFWAPLFAGVLLGSKPLHYAGGVLGVTADVLLTRSARLAPPSFCAASPWVA